MLSIKIFSPICPIIICLFLLVMLNVVTYITLILFLDLKQCASIIVIVTQLNENVAEFYIIGNTISRFPPLRSQGRQIDVYIEVGCSVAWRKLSSAFLSN